MFDLPTDEPKNKLKWAYRALGGFSGATSSYGSYSVLLALRFFATTMDSRTTAFLGLEMWPKNEKKWDKEKANTAESDLALFLRDNYSFWGKPDLLFAECKTYNKQFIEKDVRSMTLLSGRFPDAFFLFATLEKSLTDDEKGLISSFNQLLRKNEPRSHISTRLLILTGTELYSEKKPPDCWTGTIDSIPEHSHSILMNKKLLGLCELTQKMYLESD